MSGALREAALLELLDGLTCNVLDVAAADAEVAQFPDAHAAEFVAGLTILAPIVERACEVHDPILSRVVCQRLSLGWPSSDDPKYNRF